MGDFGRFVKSDADEPTPDLQHESVQQQTQSLH
jgi:hypothetical protein